MADDPLAEVRGKTTEFSALLYDILLHSVVLSFLAILNFGVEGIVSWFQPIGVQNIIFRTVQALFGAATIVPVCIFVIRDLWVLGIKAKKKIKAAQKEGP